MNDPTLLFTNAGMNQFKETFLGLEHRDYARAASSQKCLRAGGKHNDLDNVGRTRRHHTFFEMLGNFSFGDYFKKEAIEYAWELVTKEYRLPVERLYVTVFGGGTLKVYDPTAQIPEEALPLGEVPLEKDRDGADYWEKVGVPTNRIFDGSVTDNFWVMGYTGPCGPCSEIHYDLGPESSDEGHADCAFPCDCGRYVEIWNLVFMQFNLPGDRERLLELLPRPCVDTGMGLERMATVIQSKLSNFETDLLRPLIQEAAFRTQTTYGENPSTDVSLRILADHSRAATFLIHDGVLPTNEGRGYVLRKILRRAACHGGLLGQNNPFLYQMCTPVATMMSGAYPELGGTLQHVAQVVKSEEQRFAHTMTVALQEFEKAVIETSTATAKGPMLQTGDRLYVYKHDSKPHETGTNDPVVLSGERLFRLYDTFGMPLDWMEELANERGLRLDKKGFDEAMRLQRERTRASWKGVAKAVLSPAYAEVLKRGRSVFEGYQQTTSHGSVLAALLKVSSKKESGKKDSGKAEMVEEIPAGSRAELVLDRTPFYAESGGQVGDTGVLLSGETHENEAGEEVAVVEGTYSPVSGVIAHHITTRAPLCVGDRLTAVAHPENRRATMRNHTATHLLHAALREVLGTHVKQAGSVVEPSRLRFDFAHFTSVEENELVEIERLVNAEILRNTAVETDVMGLEQAVETGAMALFGEKYQDRVRVVSVPGFSKELCGGTHVSRTGDIGLFKIIAEGSISAGVRRLEAVTGEKALKQFQAVTAMVHRVAGVLKSSATDLVETVEKLAASERNLGKQVESLKLKAAQSQLSGMEDRIRSVKEVKVLSLRLEALDRNQMRSMADFLRQKLRSGVVVLATASDRKVALIAALTQDLTTRLHAGKIAQAVARKLGGTGGGRPDIAEAGGKNVTELNSVLDEVYDIVAAML